MEEEQEEEEPEAMTSTMQEGGVEEEAQVQAAVVSSCKVQTHRGAASEVVVCLPSVPVCPLFSLYPHYPLLSQGDTPALLRERYPAHRYSWSWQRHKAAARL